LGWNIVGVVALEWITGNHAEILWKCNERFVGGVWTLSEMGVSRLMCGNGVVFADTYS